MYSISTGVSVYALSAIVLCLRQHLVTTVETTAWIAIAAGIVCIVLSALRAGTSDLKGLRKICLAMDGLAAIFGAITVLLAGQPSSGIVFMAVAMMAGPMLLNFAISGQDQEELF